MRLRTSPNDLERVCDNAENFYTCWDQEKNGKVRPIASPRAPLRGILDQLNNILQRLYFPENLHGGIRGRSTRTYASAHVGRSVLLKFDLQDFFPSIKSGRVYTLFREELGCSPNVARYLTRLTTHHGAVPQGSPTSTILAALVTRPLAIRVSRLANSIDGRADMYVDDGVLSGPPYAGRFKRTIARVISQEGFRAHPLKTKSVVATEEQVLTGIRVNTRIDAPREKIQLAKRRIQDVRARVSRGERIPHRDLQSVRGLIRWIQSLNLGTGRSLMRQLTKALGATSAQGS